ncbi:DUF7220 family protein [Denitratisoma oestradiolicum]|uniref:Uncharacterized protein n=1 Tax=Denitratisoma oestradiolicum TaxID=311182 RepID=A0A6S6Y3L3_9PROT|nr:hypothetical protein [Denitratisoma oestradiolicum]CAB1367218.1 conserved protein of unknown function [Denitratisoma oestradiolicum]
MNNRDAGMKQSRWMSLVEAVTNVLVGYGVAVATQWAVFPLFGLHATLQENLLIGLIFTAVSLVRSYVLRRAFEAFRIRQLSGNSG